MSTPATYAFARHYAPRVLRKRKDLLLKILGVEKDIYTGVFNLFAALYSKNSATFDREFKMFCSLLDDLLEEIPIEHIKAVGEPVSIAYFTLAEDRVYWIPGMEQNPNGVLSYPDFLIKWKDDQREVLARGEEHLKQFRAAVT